MNHTIFIRDIEGSFRFAGYSWSAKKNSGADLPPEPLSMQLSWLLPSLSVSFCLPKLFLFSRAGKNTPNENFIHVEKWAAAFHLHRLRVFFSWLRVFLGPQWRKPKPQECIFSAFWLFCLLKSLSIGFLRDIWKFLSINLINHKFWGEPKWGEREKGKAF